MAQHREEGRSEVLYIPQAFDVPNVDDGVVGSAGDSGSGYRVDHGHLDVLSVSRMNLALKLTGRMDAVRT